MSAFIQPAPSSGIGGSTGSTDNALLRADGTGGSTAQASAPTIDDAGNVALVSGYISFGNGVGPVLRNSGSDTLQVLNSGINGFVALMGKITTETAATTGLVAGVFAAATNATLTIYDVNGTAYDIPAKPH